MITPAIHLALLFTRRYIEGAAHLFPAIYTIQFSFFRREPERCVSKITRKEGAYSRCHRRCCGVTSSSLSESSLFCSSSFSLASPLCLLFLLLEDFSALSLRLRFVPLPSASELEPSCESASWSIYIGENYGRHRKRLACNYRLGSS